MKRKRADGSTYRMPKCRICYLRDCARYKRSATEVIPEPPPIDTARPPIPLSDRVARVQRDAQELVWILSRYMIRSKEGATYLRLRPKEGDRRAVALKVERLVVGIWDAALGNTDLGFGPVDPRTNREIS
jgi:hypothetical protein